VEERRQQLAFGQIAGSATFIWIVVIFVLPLSFSCAAKPVDLPIR
jgi:hypothetical protein